jgi:hypothetical protein
VGEREFQQLGVDLDAQGSVEPGGVTDAARLDCGRLLSGQLRGP